MDIDELRNFCLGLKGVTEDCPFGPENLVFRVGGKIFALTNLDSHPLRVNLKCDPERAVELREQYSSIQPGYHMNKTHWNTVIMDESIPYSLCTDLVEHSYNLVFKSLPKTARLELQSQE